MRTGVVGSGENPDLCVRPARPSDADGLSKILTQLVVAGKRRKPCNPDYALNHYIQHDHQVLCSVAISSSGEILGFQSLKAAWVGNPYEVHVGWGIIGTHVQPRSTRIGVGRALFRATLAAARARGLEAIDATIGLGNAEGLQYYKAMGFQPYRDLGDAVSKVFHIE